MSETTTVQVTEENAADFLEAAAQAQAEADGKTEAEDTTEESSTEETTEASEEEAAVDSLEIKPKEEEAEADAESSDEPQSLDLDSYYAEYAEKGELSEESTKTIVDVLTKAGIANPEEALQTYIAGQEAKVSTIQNEAFGIVGGQAEYGQMISWAAENLSADEIETFNEMVSNPKTAKLAVSGLNSQFVAAGGKATPKPNPRVASTATAQSGFKPVNSLQHIAEITADPRFDTDPAWRQQQEARIKASMDAGLLN